MRQAGRAARTTSWSQMDLALRRRIQEIACLVFAPGPRTTITSSSTTPRVIILIVCSVFFVFCFVFNTTSECCQINSTS